MSLIHNMLEDLEKRKNIKGNSLPANLMRPSKTSFQLSAKFWLIVTNSIFIAFAFGIAWHFIHKPSNKMLNMLDLNKVVSDSSRHPLEAKWSKPVSVNGVTIQLKDNITELTFLLDHAALYRLLSNDMQSQISIIIDQSHLKAELPPVNYLNTAIKNLSSQTINNDTKFTLTLVPGAFIKYVNLNEADKEPELTIAIQLQTNPNKTPTNQSEKNIKMPALQGVLTQQYQSALQTAQSGDVQTAIQQLASLLKADADYYDARVSLTALLLKQGKLSQAEYTIDQGLQTHADYLPYIELKARILANQGKASQALDMLQHEMPSIEENPEYHALMAAMYERTNDHHLAANLYKQLLTINPQNGNWWFGLGVSLDKIGQQKDAMEAYSKAMTEGQLNANSLAYVKNRLRQLHGVIDDKE